MAKNDTNKLVELLFYMLPKYMNGYNKNSNEIKMEREIDLLSMKEIYDVIKKLRLMDINELNERKKKIDKEYVGRGNKKEKNIKEDIGDKSKRENKGEEHKENIKNTEKEIKKISHTGELSNCLKDKKNLKYEYGIRNILTSLINKRVTFYISDPIKGLIINAIIVKVKNSTIELRTEENTTIMLYMNEVVAIKCSELNSINFNDVNTIFDNGSACKKDEFGIYLSSIVGKKVYIQTKGCEQLRYMYNKIITAVGTDFVVIEGDILLSLKKIVLVET